MAIHRSVGQFNEEIEDWTAYFERLVQYFTANNIEADGKRRAVLLTVCGAHIYQLVRSLVSPGKPTDKSFGDIPVVKLVRDHLTPPPSCIVRRFDFNSCVQRETESVAQSVDELRRLSEFCEFGDSLDVMLRDRLVCGFHEAQVQRRLFAEPNLTFTKAFELAQAAELAERSLKDVVRPVGAAVHSLQEPKPTTATGEMASLTFCYRC